MSSMRNLLFKLRFVIFIKMIIALKFCNSAGGRGGAIATKGGSRVPGVHTADPNDDSGSLSVILVVILPVAQMFAVLVLILLVRICYRKYCSKSKHEPQTKPGFYTNRLSPSIHVNRF